MALLARRRRPLLVALVAVLAAALLTPPALLVREQQHAEQHLLQDAQRQAAGTRSITALAVEGLLRGSRDALDAQAARPETLRALHLPPGGARDAALDELTGRLQRADSAAASSFAVDARGTLLRNWPSTPQLHGLGFAERDWYRGAVAQYGSHVSEGFRSALPGQPLAVAVARAVRGPDGRVAGVLGSVVRLDAVQELVDAQSGLSGLTVRVVDRRGQVLARTGARVEALEPLVDQRLQAVWQGAGPRSGRPARAAEGSVWSVGALRRGEGAVLVSIPGGAVVGDLPDQVRTTRLVLALLVLVLLVASAVAVRLVRLRLASQRSLRASEAQLRAALGAVEAQRAQLALGNLASGVGHCTIDPDTLDVTYSDEALALLGVAPDDPRRHDGALFREQVLHPGDGALLASRLLPVVREGGTASAVVRAHRLDDGRLRYLRITVTRERQPDGALAPVVRAGVLDATDLEEARRAAEEAAVRLRAAAERDALTGLPNRALLADRLAAALARSGRSGQQVAVVLVDLDGFKRVNDTAGHQAGDALLVEVARRLEGCVRAGDTVARLGGDEFVLVLEPEDGVAAPASATLVAHRLQEAIGAPVVLDGVAHHVTASAGLAFSSGPDDDPERLLADADAAMYRAKDSGKDRYEVFEVALRAESQRRSAVEAALRDALHRRSTTPAQRSSGDAAGARLSVVLQPVVGPDGAVRGVEALARLHDAAGEPVPPLEFVPVAEATGLVAALGAAVLEDALADAARLRASCPDLRVAVNLSALQAREPGLVDLVRTALERHGLPPAALVLEVTESVLLEAAGPEGSALRALHGLGVRLAIDDFGTGYGSLRYLAQLPVDIVKIDRSFVSGLPHDRVGTAVVAAVARLADELGLVCVAEGVETEEQRAALPPGLLLQGYLLGRPVPAAQVDLEPRPVPAPVE